jgi:FkbM family methyltransferase
LKRRVRQLTRRLGFDVIRYPSRRRTLGDAFQQLARVGVDPAGVIDVGIGARGTPELYEAFPDARYLLVEPVAEYEPVLKRILERVDGGFAVVAATSTTGTVPLRVAMDDPEASTLFEEEGSHSFSEREVPGIRLDDLVAERMLDPPYLIKADVQGAELEALKGAERTLEQTEAVTLEASLFEFYRGAPQLADVIAFMQERGFVVYDIVGGHERPLDGALAQVDLVFVQEVGICRRSHRYEASGKQE